MAPRALALLLALSPAVAAADEQPPQHGKCTYAATLTVTDQSPTTAPAPECEPGEREDCHWGTTLPETPPQPTTGVRRTVQVLRAAGTCRFGTRLKGRDTPWGLDLDDAHPRQVSFQVQETNSANGEHTEGELSGPARVAGQIGSDGRGVLGLEGNVALKTTFAFYSKKSAETRNNTCTLLSCTREERSTRMTVGATSFTLSGLEARPDPGGVDMAVKAGAPFVLTISGESTSGTVHQVASITVHVQEEPLCGPEITDALARSVEKIKTHWTTAMPAIDQRLTCEMLVNPLVSAWGWDFAGMHDDQGWTRCGDERCARPSGDGGCYASVVVKDRCFYTGSVNYILFGLFARLCEEASWGSPLRGGDYQGFIWLWKVALPTMTGDPPAANYGPASAWAKAGYDGWPEAPTPDADRGQCDRSCKTSFDKAYPFQKKPGTLLLRIFPTILGL